MKIHRREVLAASAAGAVSTALVAPVLQRLREPELTMEELRILALCASPTAGLTAEEYNRDRILDDRGDEIAFDLERRGYLELTPASLHLDCKQCATATDKGRAYLRSIGA